MNNKKYNGLARPILLFDKEDSTLTPQAGLQPSYGPWSSLSEARLALIKDFGDIANVPNGYTFAIINANNVPEEWWFTEDGDWLSIKKKTSGQTIDNLLQFMIDGDELCVSYDGGKYFTKIGKVITPDVIRSLLRLLLDNDGTLKISYDGGKTFDTIAKFKFKLTETGYLKVSFDDGITWVTADGHINVGGGGSQNPSGDGGSIAPVDNITDGNIGDIEFKNKNDDSTVVLSGQDACDLLVYIGTDYPTTLNEIFSSKYPAARVGDYIIIRSTLYDRTGGKSNESDDTHTYELDPTWTTVQVLQNNSQDDWYYYYKITKVDADVWAPISWVGRAEKVDDVTRYTITIGTVTPSEAVVTVTYKDVAYNVRAGSTMQVDEGSTIIINATADGYNDFSRTIENISDDTTIDVNMVQTATGYTITVNSCTSNDVELWYAIIDTYFDTANDLNHDKFTQINIGDSFIVPYGKGYDLRCEPIWKSSGQNYSKWRNNSDRKPTGDEVIDIVLEKADVLYQFTDGTHAIDEIEYTYATMFHNLNYATGQNIGLPCNFAGVSEVNKSQKSGQGMIIVLHKEGYYIQKAVDAYWDEVNSGKYSIPINLNALPSTPFLKVTPCHVFSGGWIGYGSYKQEGNTITIIPDETRLSGNKINLACGFLIETSTPISSITTTEYPGLTVHLEGSMGFPEHCCRCEISCSDYAEFDISNGIQTIHVVILAEIPE